LLNNADDNTALGAHALENNTGFYNSATGFEALQNNSTGSQNTANGVFALVTNNTGYDNTAKRSSLVVQ
jgi:hypothetical protein